METALRRSNGRDTKAYYHHLDFRRIDDLDDEGLAYLLTGVKDVNMLDLNETEISNESIRLLTGQDYVRELQLKECRHLDNDCIDSLDQLTALEFLYVKNTDITIDGLLKLHHLPNLKRLLFSAGDANTIEEKCCN